MTKNLALRLADQIHAGNGQWMQEAANELRRLHRENKWLKAALEAKDEPVAWMHIQGNYKEPSLGKLDNYEIKRGWEQYPLYTTPPQRTWVGLTDEEVEAYDSWEDFQVGCGRQTLFDMIRDIEAKLKERNT